jgi:hypothetical protein
MKKQWQQLEKEFGSDAYNRVQEPFKLKGLQPLYFKSNKEVDSALKDGICVELKPLPELFAHDCEVYGEDNALQMWDYEILPCGGVGGCCYDYPNPIKRKTSAALPFDLQRAKNGDVVEIYHLFLGKWIDCKFEFNGEGYGYSCTFNLNGKENTWQVFEKCDLRMKYPPKKEQNQ